MASASAHPSSSPSPPRAFSWPWTSPPSRRPPPIPAPTQQPLLPLTHRRSTTLTPSSPPSRRLSLLNLPHPSQGQLADMQGCAVSLPAPPFVSRPRASYNAASLAYLGDCIYELYVRCYFLSPPQSIEKYNTLVMGMVCCEAQDSLLQALLKHEFLSEEERDIIRWGQNVHTNHKRASKRAGAAVYSRASSLETLIGYLYLTNHARLQELMKVLGLSWNSNAGLQNTKSKG